MRNEVKIAMGLNQKHLIIWMRTKGAKVGCGYSVGVCAIVVDYRETGLLCFVSSSRKFAYELDFAHVWLCFCVAFFLNGMKERKED